MKDPIKEGSRLLALEYLALHTYNMVMRLSGASEDAIRAAETSGLEAIGLQTLAGRDPALSDHASAELRDALADLLDGAREMRMAGKMPGPT